MNKKTVSKVNLFFGGLVSRMEENKDFFNDIEHNIDEYQFKEGKIWELKNYC